ncbi:hypothetical protein BDN72DRAFT_96045 [Pluteus cervinus]|uniref:Uncharacterized protein n=1 Tax=Pluteus cervinus TaxID=181527 RepID=A0ACD3AP26_9AGAR|nr:hypothetical protein BDN72DRAFT_96045 [Pluteus cervinus]
MRNTEPLRFYDPHASKRSQIDHEISLLKQQIQKLQIERNALLPISSIPNEILSDIFLLCRCTTIQPMLTLLNLTWVCHQWRIAALSTPSLWAYLGDENLWWFGECLTRSKAAPFEGVLRGTFYREIETIIIPLMPRFRRLSVRIFSNFDYEFLAQPAPILESLTLADAPIQAPLFSGVFPLLRTVLLSLCKVTSWTSNALPFLQLKHLSIRGCDGISFITLIQNLPPSLPNLESLALHSTTANSSDLVHGNTPLRRVHFPNLKTFDLGGFMPPLIEFLESCRFASSTRTSVDVSTYSDHTALQFRQLLLASERLEHHPDISIRVFYHEVNPDNGTSTGRFILNASHPPCIYESPLWFKFEHSICWSQLSQIFESVPANNVTTLTLDIPDIRVDDWVNIFTRFVDLQELVLEETVTVRAFIEFIVNSSSADSSGDTLPADLDSSPTFPFRSLRKLRLCTRYFKTARSRDRREFLAFCSALKLRRDSGVLLEELWVPEGAFHLDLLEEIVDEVCFS